MTWLATIAISNAIVATVLGVIAYVVGRSVNNAAIGHALWILVLVKLVTPPLLDVPLPILPEWAVVSGQRAEVPVPSAVSNLGAMQIADAAATDSDVAQQVALVRAEAESGMSAREMFSLAATPLLLVWGIGVVVYGLYQLYVTWQMCILMKMATPHPRIDRAMHRIATAAKVKNYPTARVVPWVGSPMLWGLGGTSVIVLPQELFESMDDAAADTLMQHELAHFQRGDQWVRILEVIVSSLFWWHPIVWMALREIEVYEEQCCDSWVVRQNVANRRLYAEALLDTVDFISDAPGSAMPIAASGLGRVPLLKQRLKSIMKGEQQVMGSRCRIAVALLLVSLPLQPRLLKASLFSTRVSPSTSVDSAFVGLVEGIRQHGELSEEKLDNRTEVRTAPGIEYAKAHPIYGTYELVATSGYRLVLRDIVTFNSHDLSDRRIACVAFAPESDESTQQFVAGSRDGKVWVFDCDTGQPVMDVASYGHAVRSVVYALEGNQVAVAGDEGIVHLVGLTGARTARTIDAGSGPISCVRYSDDGQKLAVVYDTTWHTGVPGRVDIWDLATITREQTIRCPTAVGVAEFDETGRVLTAEWNGTLRTWLPSGEQVDITYNPKDVVSAAAFSPDTISLRNLALSESEVID